MQDEKRTYIMPSDCKLYKGTKYFYTAEKEMKLFSWNEINYFGDKYVAHDYAQMYSGGI